MLPKKQPLNLLPCSNGANETWLTITMLHICVCISISQGPLQVSSKNKTKEKVTVITPWSMQNPLKYKCRSCVQVCTSARSSSSLETGIKVLTSAPFAFVQLLDISTAKQFIIYSGKVKQVTNTCVMHL